MVRSRMYPKTLICSEVGTMKVIGSWGCDTHWQIQPMFVQQLRVLVGDEPG